MGRCCQRQYQLLVAFIVALARRHAQTALEIYNDLDDINRDWITATEQILRR